LFSLFSFAGRTIHRLAVNSARLPTGTVGLCQLCSRPRCVSVCLCSTSMQLMKPYATETNNQSTVRWLWLNTNYLRCPLLDSTPVWEANQSVPNADIPLPLRGGCLQWVCLQRWMLTDAGTHTECHNPFLMPLALIPSVVSSGLRKLFDKILVLYTQCSNTTVQTTEY